MRGILFTLMCCACAVAFAAAPTVYKWVDEKGVVHYTDKPPETTDKASVELNKQGVPIRRIEPPPT